MSRHARGSVVASLVILLCSAAISAQSFEFTFVRSPVPQLPPEERCSPGIIACADGYGPRVGELVYFDLYLDTQGQSDIQLFSLGMVYDPTSVIYRPDLSGVAADDFLYAPSSSKTEPATWLVPNGEGINPWPTPPGGLAQLNFEFYEANLRGTVATATNLLLARVVFEAAGPSGGFLDAGWDHGGNIFRTEQLGEWAEPPDVRFAWAPEPSTALLVGVGLVSLSRRRLSR